MSMGKQTAKKIVNRGVTAWELRKLLLSAYDNGRATNEPSNVNPLFSKGWAFNIFWKGISKSPDDKIMNKGGDFIVAMNILREFGKDWTGYRPQPRKTRKKLLPSETYHEEAIDPRKHLK